MAKYFSSPSRSQPSVYSQDEVYYLLGENSSMKKLLTEVMLRFDFISGVHSAHCSSRNKCNVNENYSTKIDLHVESYFGGRCFI